MYKTWGWFNIKAAVYQHRDSHYNLKMRPSHHYGNCFSGKTTTLYWINLPILSFLHLNAWGPRQKFVDDRDFQIQFFVWKWCLLIPILQIFPLRSTNNKPSLVQIMTGCQTGNKAIICDVLPWWPCLLTHIWVTLSPQWVNSRGCTFLKCHLENGGHFVSASIR